MPQLSGICYTHIVNILALKLTETNKNEYKIFSRKLEVNIGYIVLLSLGLLNFPRWNPPNISVYSPLFRAAC